jgi:DNA polymerase-1
VPFVESILAALRRDGFAVGLVDSRVRVRPADKLTPGRLALLRRHKDALAALLARPAPAPHKKFVRVSANSGNVEWYTPPEILEAARAVLGGIDLDPASCEIAQRTVKAARYYTVADDGLAQDWHGRVWLNTPYAAGLVGRFVEKLLAHVEAGDVTAAILLTNNATDTRWFQAASRAAAAACFPSGRIRFAGPEGPRRTPLQGQAILYFGPTPRAFVARFGGFGRCLVTGLGAPPDAGDPAAAQGEEAPAAGYVLVTGPRRLDRLVRRLNADPAAELGVDVETTHKPGHETTPKAGLSPRTGRIRLVQLALGGQTYVVDFFWIGEARQRRLLNALTPHPLVAHNARFELSFLAALGFEPAGKVTDTMILSQLLHAGDPGARHSLEAVAERHLGKPLDKQCQNSDWSTATLTADQLRYAAKDAEILAPLARTLHREVAEAGLDQAAEIELRALPAVAWLAGSGVPFDRDGWLALEAPAKAAAAAAAAELDALAPSKPPPPPKFTPTGRPSRAKVDPKVYQWNYNSADQLLAMLDLAGVDLPLRPEWDYGRRAWVDKRSTAKEVLEQVDHPLAAALLRYKEAQGRVSKFGASWLRSLGADGRLHADWFQMEAATGRMSCRKPPLQQMPRDPAYRRCVRAPEGRVLVKCDYGQIELRIAAKISGDAAMLAAYERGEDLHDATARNVLGAETVTKAHRQLAKPLNFGLVYGMGANGLRPYARGYGVELTVEQAGEYRDDFFRAYPGLAAWHRAVSESRGDTRTLAGRRRLFPRHDDDSLAARLNAPVQGTGADGLKLALALLWERRHDCPAAFPVIACHDEIVVECTAAYAKRAAAWLAEAMRDGKAPLLDPVPVGPLEAKVGPTWAAE